MGFWGGLGKILLKAAPIAAAFIPGVGPLASMAIGAGTGALSKKLEGGSGKDILMGAATGGLAGYGSGKAAKGLGPSAKISDKIKTGIGRATGGGSSRNIPGGMGGGWGGDGATPPYFPRNGGGGGGNDSWGDTISGALERILASRGGGGEDIGIGPSGRTDPMSRRTSVGGGGRGPMGVPQGDVMFGGRMGRRIGPAMNQVDQSNPNLALSIGQGRSEAIRARRKLGGIGPGLGRQYSADAEY